MANIITPTPSDEDYNIPSPRRVELLQQLLRNLTLEEGFKDKKVYPAFWAACYLCDLSALERLVQLSETSPLAVVVFHATSSELPLLCGSPGVL